MTKVCKYPLTNPYSCFDELGKAFYFTSLDLASAYWSIPLADEDKEKTAFTVRSGKYEFTVMPFGLTNAVATFCSLMDLVFAGMQWSFIMCFVDDCLIYTPKDFNLHLQHVEAVFQRLVKANLSLKLTKCKFAFWEVEFYGHIVPNTGLKMAPSKIEAITKLVPPKDKHGIRHILGVAGFYRNFIQNYAEIVAPFTAALAGGIQGKISWTPNMQQAFELLKQKFSEYPILQFPDFDKEFILETDANLIRLAALLNQYKGDEMALIACASRVLSKHEKNYSIPELELLAIVWALEHFRPYLYGRTFHIITDHKALTMVMKMTKPTSKITRMLLQLQEYDYHISFRPGKLNTVADALTRLPTTEDDQQSEEAVILEFCDHLFHFDPCATHSNTFHTELNVVSAEAPINGDPKSISIEDFREQQRSDPKLLPIFQFMESNTLIDDPKLNAEIVAISRYLTIQNGLLFHF